MTLLLTKNKKLGSRTCTCYSKTFVVSDTAVQNLTQGKRKTSKQCNDCKLFSSLPTPFK